MIFIYNVKKNSKTGVFLQPERKILFNRSRLYDYHSCRLEIAMPQLRQTIEEGVLFDSVFCLNDLANVGAAAAQLPAEIGPEASEMIYRLLNEEPVEKNIFDIYQVCNYNVSARTERAASKPVLTF